MDLAWINQEGRIITQIAQMFLDQGEAEIALDLAKFAATRWTSDWNPRLMRGAERALSAQGIGKSPDL